MNTDMQGPKISRLADGLAAAVFLLGVASRIWGAWLGRFLIVPDSSVVGLMARHMAEGTDFPVFFYGQAYMGSLEPMASALLILLMGPTGFAVSLGPVLFAAAALAILWRWARDAAGPWGGLAALLAGLIGPAVYFHFQVSPRGGYMVALFVDALALWAAARMAARLRAGEPVGWGRYLALGLLAGVGMWSNLIVASALLVSALLLLHGMRGRFWRHAAGLVAGLAGFLAGMLPWLAYNARHAWSSLEMSQVSRHEPMARTLGSMWNRFLMLQSQEIGPLKSVSPLVLAVAVLGLAAVGAGVVVSQRRRASLRENYARAAAIWFCVVFALVFAISGFTRTHTARYWVPVVPGLAVLAAVACAVPGPRWRRGVAWTGLVALTFAQGAVLVPTVRAFSREAQAMNEIFEQIGSVLDHAGTDALLAPIQFYGMNFTLGERHAVSDGKQAFYEPILRRVELSPSPAYFSGFLGIMDFLQEQGGTYDSVFSGRQGIVWNVRPPAVSLREIPIEKIARLRDGRGGDVKAILTDRNLDTWWSPHLAQKERSTATLEWTFTEPQEVHSVRLVFDHDWMDSTFDIAEGIQVETKTGGQWQAVRVDVPLHPLEWSGPRVYYPSGLVRLEYRVGGQAIEGVRIGLFRAESRHHWPHWCLGEAMLFAAEEAVPPAMDLAAVDALGEWLRQEQADSIVYAPRWLSNQLLARGWIGEDRLPGLSARVFPPDRMARDGSVVIGNPLFFLVEPHLAEATRATLEAQGISHREQAAGPWVAFAVEAGGFAVGGVDLSPAVRWTGDALLAGHVRVHVEEVLHRLRTGGDGDGIRKSLLREIIRWRPSALSAVAEGEVARLGGEEAVQARRSFARVPQAPCPTEFANGFWLEGLEVEPAEAKAGDEVAVRLYWSTRGDFQAGNELVFIHLRDDNNHIVAQDDYREALWLWDHPNLEPVARECVEETRKIRLPAGVPPGPLRVCVGLYQPVNGRRIRVLRTEAPEVRRHAVTWPGLLDIQP